jgi:DNA polymerase elongation subunit (family B)
VVRTPDETSMIHGFFQLVNLFDPSFVTGFNDYQFDFPFIRDKITTFDTNNGKFKIIQLLYRGFFTQQP